MSGIAVGDVFAAPGGPALTITCPAAPLAPGASATCTATYPASQADIDFGSITSTATATGLSPASTPVTSNSSTTTVGVTQTTTLTIATTTSQTNVTAAGTVVNYTFTVKNTGNTSATGVSVSNVFTAPARPPLTITCAATALAPAATTTCTASYTVKQADIDKGSIRSSATANGLDPDGLAVASAPAAAAITVTRVEALTLVKTSDVANVTAAGQLVHYSFAVTNTGNLSLTDLAVTDTFTPPAGPELTVTCPVTALAPAATTTCTGTYTVTQADLNSGSVNNSATASAADTRGVQVTSPASTATVTATRSASLGLTETTNPTTVTAAGQNVDYTFAVTNTGNVTLTGIAIADAFTAPAGPPLAIVCATTTLAPGATTSCTARYTSTQADLNAGSIVDSATAAGKDPSATTVISNRTGATVTATQNAGLTLVTTVVPTTATTAGQQVTFSFVVTNSGNTSVTAASVTATMAAPGGPVPTITCPATALAPAASTTCTAVYTVTQADVDAGSITLTGTARGTGPGGVPLTSAPSTAAVTIAQSATLTVAQTESTAVVTAAGQPITYSIVVTNTGNTTVTNLAASETFFAPAGPAVPTCPVASLAPGASTTCTVTYVATQADIDHGVVDSVATASGTGPGGLPVTADQDGASIDVEAPGTLSAVKTADPTVVDVAGDTVDYTVQVVNTGSITLNAIGVNDTLSAPAGPALDLVCPVTSLAPGAGTLCTATYTATQADIDSGEIDNSAVAVGTRPDGGGVALGDVFTSPAGPALTPVCAATVLAVGATTTCTATYTTTQADLDKGTIVDQATATAIVSDDQLTSSDPTGVTVTANQAPAVTLSTVVSPGTYSTVGQQVTYTVMITNSGNVTLSGADATLDFAAPAGPDPVVTCPAVPFAPGAKASASATASSKLAVVQNPLPNSVANTVALRKNVSLAACAASSGGWSASGTATNPVVQGREVLDHGLLHDEQGDRAGLCDDRRERRGR